MSLIHKNNAISTIEKFNYLKASVIGEAARVIESLELSEVNYAIAWELLVNRFQNTKQIIKNHIREIILLPSIYRNYLRKILNAVMRYIRALKACEQPVDHIIG